MTPQLIAMLEADASLMIFALFVIAFGVLRLQPRQMVTAQAQTTPMIHVSPDTFFVDTADLHYETIIHHATSNGYRFSERRSGIETYVRKGYHGPAGAWR